MKNNRDKIVKFCEEYLEVDKFSDYCKNGLQLEGRADVGKIITGVSFSMQLIDAAIERNADMIMVHHGLFDGYIKHPISIKGLTKERLKKMLANDISLLGFHLPLDAHPIIGNNASICRILGVSHLEKHDVGFVGELERELGFEEFVELVNQKLETNSYKINAGTSVVKKVAVVSGSASVHYQEAVDLGADTFLTGDVKEQIVREVEEVGLNFINAGHYNTEKLGIKNLGELVAEKFKVEVEFVDVPNRI